MAQRPREAERFERPVFPAQPVKHKPEAAVSRAALSVTPPFAQPLPVAARRHFRRRPRSSLADRAAPCLFLTPHPRGARPEAGLVPLPQGFLLRVGKMCCEKWSRVAEMFLFIEDLEEDCKILCLCSRAFVE